MEELRQTELDLLKVCFIIFLAHSISVSIELIPYIQIHFEFFMIFYVDRVQISWRAWWRSCLENERCWSTKVNLGNGISQRGKWRFISWETRWLADVNLKKNPAFWVKKLSIEIHQVNLQYRSLLQLQLEFIPSVRLLFVCLFLFAHITLLSLACVYIFLVCTNFNK